MKKEITKSTAINPSTQQASNLKDEGLNKDINSSKKQDNVVQLQLVNNTNYTTSQTETTTVDSALENTDVTSSSNQTTKQQASDAFIILRLNEIDVLEETFGQAVTKELSSMVNHRLQGCLRKVDALERININEFAIMVSDVAAKDQVEKLIKRIEEVCNGEYVCAGLKLHITVTAGVSMSLQYSTLYDEQLRYARIALRQAINQSNSAVQFYSEDMLDGLQERAAMIFEIRQALQQQRFILHYQPQYEVGTKKTIAVEALIRMRGQNDELIYPDGFIDLAEETGLILPIGHWVIQEACQQYKRWQDMGCAPRHIAVNVSAKQLADNSLIEIVDAAVREAGIDYSNLELEITEQSVIKKITLAETVLRELSEKGVRIALDDFGTGYSSLSHLSQLPLNVLKIDRSFLQQLETNSKSAGLIKSMIYIAKELDLEVVAEGVEDEVQHQFIKSIGCHIGQGYGFSRPKDADSVLSMLQTLKLQA